MITRSVDGRVAAVAARQHGVIAREQALRLGATRNVIDTRVVTGRWERMHRGVYRIAGAPFTWDQKLMAACLAVGPDVAVSHRAALRLYGVTTEDSPAEFQTGGRLHRIPGIVVHRTRWLGTADLARHRGFLVTSPARTLIDVAAVLPDLPLAEALDDFLRRELVTVPRLDRRMRALTGRPGLPALRALVESRRGPTVPMTVFESRLFEVLRAAGIPLPVPQYRIRVAGRLLIVDFAYPDLCLGIEADSRRYHADPTGWERDLERRNAFTLAGWSVLHVGWRVLERYPERVVETVAAALTRAANTRTSDHATKGGSRGGSRGGKPRGGRGGGGSRKGAG